MLTLCCSAILNCSDENVTIPRLPKREAAARPRATHKPFTVFFTPCRGRKQIEPWKPEGIGEQNWTKTWMTSRWEPRHLQQVAASGLSLEEGSRSCSTVLRDRSRLDVHVLTPAEETLSLSQLRLKQISLLHIETSAQRPSNYSP